MDKLTGKGFVFGDNVDTDQILPGSAMSVPESELKNYAMTGSIIPDFPQRVSPGDIIIAGDNFGCGSSREQAPVAIKESGVAAVVAKSFARIFRRNAINIGLPVIVCHEDINTKINTGDQLTLKIEKGELINNTTGEKFTVVVPPPTTMDTLKAGGLINKVRQILKERGASIDQ